MWIKKIKNRKLQHFLIAFILMSATAIMLACISFTLETKKFVNQYYQYDQCPIIFDLVSDQNVVDQLKSDQAVSNLIDRISTGTTHYVSDEFYKGDEKLNNDTILVHSFAHADDLGYAIPIVEGEQADHPGDHEIWICHVFANAMHLEVGDEFSFGSDRNQIYTITAIVDTPECPSSFIDNYPCYVNSDVIDSIPGITVTDVCMYAKDDSLSVKELDAVLPEQYKNSVVSTLDRDGLKNCIGMISGIFGGVGIAASLVILVISIVVIRYIVRSVIDKEYHMIGIYKAMGRSNREIYAIYFTSYLVTGMVGVCLGILLGRPIAIYLGKEIMNGMQGFHLSAITNWVAIGVVCFMIGTLSFNLWLVLHKVDRITPIEAISSGVRSTKKRIRRAIIPNAHSSIAMAVNQLGKRPGMNILVLFVLTISFYVCLLACSLGITMSRYEIDRNIWENLPDYSGYIKADDQDEVLEYLKNSDDVVDYVGVDINMDGIDVEFMDCDITKSAANPMTYTDFTEERYDNVPLTDGRRATNPYEVTVSTKFLEKTGYSVGDYMRLKINEKEKDFLIVGSFATTMRGGIVVDLQEQDLEALGTKANLSTILFFLRDGVSYQTFEQEFKASCTHSKIYEEFESLLQSKETVTEIANPFSAVMFAAFASFSILNIINVVYTMNKENRRKYGILKAMGFSTGYIYRQVLAQIGLISIVAVGLTMILQEFLSPVLFSLSCGVRYIYKPIGITLVVCISIYLVIMCVTAIMLLSVRKITPVELMEE